MARYKPIHKGLKLLPVDVDQQVIPGSFEHALCHVVDHELDLAEFHARYKNDDEGAPAFDPAALIKIILVAYSRGIISSRKMETACRENVLFMAVSGDSQPHFTTLAAFVSEMGDAVASLFAQVLLVCDRQGLIGREMFAIDGVKLPSNASKQKSGTRADYQRQLDTMEAAAHKMIAQQKHADTAPTDDAIVKRESLRLERLHREASQLRDWLTTHPDDRNGAKGAVRLSNRTDNESAKMATSKGVIQGYPGVAAVDETTQIIVEAQAYGTGSEQELLLPIVKATAGLRTPETVMTADAGYHSEANLKALAETSVEAYIPPTTATENGMRGTPTRTSTPPSLIHSGTKPRRLARSSVLHRKTSNWRRIARTAPAPLESGCTGMVRTAHSMGLRRSSFAERKRIASPVRGGMKVCAPRRKQRPDRSPSCRANVQGVKVSPTG